MALACNIQNIHLSRICRKHATLRVVHAKNTSALIMVRVHFWMYFPMALIA